MRKKIPLIYLSGIILTCFAVAIDAYFYEGILYEDIIMPLLWIFEGVMLSCYPSCIKKSVQSETLPALIKWNLGIHVAHMILGLSMCIPIYMILTVGRHIVLLGATLLFIPYLIGIVLARITAAKSCIALLKLAEERQLCTSHFAKVHIALHAIPIACLYSAFVVNRQLKRDPANS